MKMLKLHRIGVLTVLTLLLTACPSSNDLDRAAKASNELAHDTVIANKVVGEFYKSGRISLSTKDKLADQLAVIEQKGSAFNAQLIALDLKYPQGTLPPADITLIRENLGVIKALYAALIADLIPHSAQSAVSELGKDIATIDKVVNK